MKKPERVIAFAKEHKRAIALIAAGLAIAVLAIALAIPACSRQSSEPAHQPYISLTSDGTKTDVSLVLDGNQTDDSLMSGQAQPDVSLESSEGAAVNAASGASPANLTGEDQNDAGAPAPTPSYSSGGEGQGSSSSGSTSDSGSASQPKPQTWVVDYSNVWVEDSAAWTEQVPIYTTVERSICNVCGADITGNTAAHAKQHMLAGEGGGHHSEVSQVISGYNTVNHDAVGHWETRATGGHWE